MNLKFRYFAFVLMALLFVITLPQIVFATNEHYASQPLDGKNGQIHKDSSSIVQDDVFYDPTLKPYQTTLSRQNVVSLHWDEARGILLPDSFQVTITADITFTYLDGSGNPYTAIVSKGFNIKYFKGGQYPYRTTYTDNGAVKVTVKITNVYISPNGNTGVLAALVLENQLNVTREYGFTCTGNMTTAVNTDTSVVSTKGELQVSWAKDRMCNEYDLEWTYIDKSALINYDTTTAAGRNKLFDNNATRVSIATESYNIPLLYGDTSVLFYRVRPVQIKYSGQRVEAHWSSELSAGLGKYAFNGHEHLLNWQSSISFAEDGKRKSVLQYFDGSLRNRQTVTKDNTTDTTIVAETMYDFQGRPAITVLPVPTLSSMIKYNPNFNTDINNAEYDKSHYDDQLTSSNYCGIGAAPMSTLSGASKYYSPNNQNSNIGFNKYIPSADSLPFAETRYTQDNTGRISSQGGVGKTFQIGIGHETKYYYGTADQEDLDGLFGTEAGNYTHYFKNMVRDANGQYSVSYVDMHGRAIATALAGKPAANVLDTLASSRQLSVTKSLIDSNNNIIKGSYIESSKSLVVTKAGAHRFLYSLNPDSLKIRACNGDSICYDCLYDLTITITDDCNNQSIDSLPYVVQFSNFKIDSIDGIHNPVSFSKSFTLNLSEGTYFITKRLAISQPARQRYLDSIYMVRDLCRSTNDFVEDQKQVLRSQLDCSPTCARCSIDTFSNWTLFRPYFMTQLGLASTDTAQYRNQALRVFDDQQAQCNKLCGVYAAATNAELQMLADVTPPYGQYANPDSIDGNSIFAFDPGASAKRVYQSIKYYDESGKLDSVWLSGVLTAVGDLPMPDFISQFKEGWAQSLLAVHPEYKKLQLYSSTAFTMSEQWDAVFDSTDTYQKAVAAGFLNPLGYTNAPMQASSTIVDPFFNSTYNPAYASVWRPVLNDSMRNAAPGSGGGSPNVDMWSLATMMVQCNASDNSCYTHYSTNAYPFDMDTSCHGTQDMAWRYFRQLYTNKKNELISNILDQLPVSIDKTVVTHTLAFPSRPALTGGVVNSVAAGMDTLASFVSSSCASYAAQWWKELDACGYTAADSARILPRLIQVCKEGGDITHPLGAGTVKPSSTYNYRSFDEVIRAYNDSLRTAPSPRNLLSTTCNAYMISAPAAYDNRPSNGYQEVWNKPDSCQCSTINYLYQQYQANGHADANFAAYLLRTSGTQITNTALDSLRGLCDSTITCQFLAKPIIAPPALQCGIKDVCASCSMVGDAYTKFQISFPGISPAYDNTDSAQRAVNTLFENFMNYNLGFGKVTIDYLQFMDTCRIALSNNLCDSLQTTLAAYNNRYLNYGNPDSIHFYVAASGNTPILTNRYNEIFANGFAHVPHSITDGTAYQSAGLTISKKDTLCVNNNFTIETRIKGDTSDDTDGMHCGSLNFVFFDENGNFVSPTFERVGAPYDCGAGTLNSISSPGSNVWDTTNLARYYRSQLDWYKIKMVVKNYQVKLYVNDTLITTIAHTSPINKIVRWAAGIHRGYMDYVKVYDSTGQLQYNEEFEDCSQSASNYPAALHCASDCQSAFTAFFNQRHHKTYTYSEIDSVYSACGVSLDPCSDTTSSQLSRYTTEFTENYYRIPHYDAGGCDTTSLKIDLGGITYNLKTTLAESIHDGILQLPKHVIDSLISAGVTRGIDFDWVKAPLCADSADFTFETSIKILDTSGKYYFYPQAWFWVNPDYDPSVDVLPYDSIKPVGTVLAAVNNNALDGGGFCTHQNDISKVCTQLHPAQHTLADWTNIKLKFIGNQCSYYINDTLLFQATLSKAASKIFYWGISTWSLYSAVDYVRIYNNTGGMLYDEEFNSGCTLAYPTPLAKQCANCQTDFAQYFNQRQHTNFSYSQIDSVYKKWGVPLTTCASNGPMLCGQSQPVFPPVALAQHSPCDDTTNFAYNVGTLLYNAYKDSLSNTFNDQYQAKCIAAFKMENFTVTQPMSEFHYTLYYYDQAGNLLRTVPPSGVDMSVFSRSTYFDSVRAARAAGTVYKPRHTLYTDYRYNSLNQVMAQKTPDAGLSNFWYDRLGRLTLSENAHQAVTTDHSRRYSYTRYDYLGRITEVGQLSDTATNPLIVDSITRKQDTLDNWFLARINKKEQVTRTFYDNEYTPGTDDIPLNARNLRNRVAYTSYTDGNSTSRYNQGTFYSYDIQGNVDTLVQDYGNSSFSEVKNIMNSNNNRWERIVYQYDLVSGKVNQVSYNPRYYDVTTRSWVSPLVSFYHRYSYDAENRVTSVQTSKDSIGWETDARYEYYRHGPLARTVLGDQLVQGLDYVYTLQGWIKGMNSTALNPLYDVGRDGDTSNQNRYIARDEVGYNLNYYSGDYKAIGGIAPFPDPSPQLNATGAYRPLYNGNINSMAVSIHQFNQPYLYDYKYDQLNRLKSVDVFAGLNTSTNAWNSSLTPTLAYSEKFNYDGNGNITKANRYASTVSTPMDSLTYHYLPNTNKLTYVTDQSQGWVNGNYKIKNQNSGNYDYDEIGNLVKDSTENISSGGIKWNVYGKISEVNKNASGVLTNVKKINYYYDAGGNRIGKKVIKFGSANVAYTWYVRDAQGNALATYTASKDTTATTTLGSFALMIAEHNLYGSSRLGTQNRQDIADQGTVGQPFYSSRGLKFFELSNHLGNVLTSISDKKIGHNNGAGGVDYYNAEVVSATDYYAFGMRSRYNYQDPISLDYRYGFNGKENDNEVKGGGDQIDYGARIYDPRLGRFLSVDPLQKDYAWYTPYQYAGNKPVWKRDIDGLEEGEEGRDDREEFARERERERERVERGRELTNSNAPEEQASRRRIFDELKNETPRERNSRIQRTLALFNNYARDGVNAAQQSFGGDPLQNAIRQFNITKAQVTINKQNSEAFEGIVKNSLLTNSNSAQVASQVTLLVKGQLNGQNVSLRIRMDNITSINGVLDLTEVKFSVEQITGANYAKTLTGNQQKAFDIIANGTGVSIFVRGNAADQSLGLKSGTDITGLIKDIRVVANNPMTMQPQTVKTVPLANPATQANKLP